MLKSELATIIVLVFIVLFGVLVPVLNIKLSKFVSYRWCVVVVILALLIGGVIDFELLSNEARKILLVGGLIISGGYVVLRTLEKILANGWLRGHSIEASKGDLNIKVTNTEEAKHEN